MDLHQLVRTTVRQDPALKAKAKEEGARTGETPAMIERELRLVLARPRQSRRRRQWVAGVPV